MVKTDSIARPSMLLRSTVAKMCKAETNVREGINRLPRTSKLEGNKALQAF